MLMRLLCRKTTQKETPDSPMNGGRPLKNILLFSFELQILDFKADFFGDEVSIFVYNDTDTSWKISFLSCFRVAYETDATWRTITHVREMSSPQLGYYGQDITLTKSKDFMGFYDVSIDLTILTAKIICKDVSVEKVFNK
ncbi:MAG: hypothetical protein K2O16_07615 [Lachnospiraceae bacterium]|nr:hypothetical protein [Lachnospiraceae bacterium]